MRLPKTPSDPIAIDIAPLIDMVFQLLLFFMLTSSFIMHPGIPVALPKAASAKQLGASMLVITLTKEHLIYFNEDLITLKALKRRLSEEAGDHRGVLIRADRYAYVDKLIELWDLCRDVGLSEVHIATLPE